MGGKYNAESCDILIIGGGVAGCIAATAAFDADPDADIVLLEKAAIKRSGATARGMDAMNVAMVPGESTTEEYLESLDIISQGVFLEENCRVLVENSFKALKKLEAWGVPFPRDGEGRYLTSRFHPKGKFMVEMRGDNFKPILAEQLRSRGIRVYERTMATRLITVDGVAQGVVSFNVRTGEPLIVSAKAVILTCGGAGRVGLPSSGYLHGTFNPPYNSGDGFSMAYRAGVELVNMEYTGTSAMSKDYNGPGLSTYIRHDGHLVNSLGERFLERYAPDLMERAPAGIRYQAVLNEINDGRGPVYFKLSHLPEDTLDVIEEGVFTVERPTMKQFYESRGTDIRKDLIEIRLSEVYMEGGHGMAGLFTNEKAETSIRGLYAAGDVVANPYGFITAALVYGEIAAYNALQYIGSTPFHKINHEPVEKELKRINLPLERKQGIPPQFFEYKIRRTVNEYLQPPKSETKLMKALEYINRLRKDTEYLVAEDSHGVMKVHEALSILDCFEMSVRASLERKESRWGLMHMRTDYQKRDDENYFGFIVVKKNQIGSMETSIRKLGKNTK